MTSRAMSNPLLSSCSSCFVFTKHPVQLKTVTTCFQNMFFSKRATKQKGGCLDTLDTLWIRQCMVSRCPVLCSQRNRTKLVVERPCVYIDIFTARCYASAVLAMGLCLSVCLSVCHKPVFY